tara:strand:- start:1753 stop:2175 length:423 start_codon:yes stop_codon:yes gene_type:complete
MDIDTLKQNRKKKNIAIIPLYSNMINKLWNKIQHYDNNNEVNYLYQLPNIIIGEPYYNRDVALDIITNKFQKGGFLVNKIHMFENVYLLIDWSEIYKPVSKKKSKKKLTKDKATPEEGVKELTGPGSSFKSNDLTVKFAK